MKLVVAIIQPEKLDAVKQSLFNQEITKMTVTRVRGCGQQGGYEESYRGQIQAVNLLEKIRIEIAVNDDFVVGRSPAARRQEQRQPRPKSSEFHHLFNPAGANSS